MEQSIVFGSDERTDMLQVVTDLHSSHAYGYVDKQVTKLGIDQQLHVNDGERYFTPPVFFIITDQFIPAEALTALTSIRFNPLPE